MALTTESALRKDKRNAQRNLNGTLQHRHFAVIAGIIAEMDGEDFEGLKGTIARRFADELRHSNANFNRSRFLRACGVEE